MTAAETFYDQLVLDTESAFQESNVRQKNPAWGYAICATPIRQRKPVICGLNWGGGEEGKVTNYPDSKVDWSYAARLKPWLRDYLNINIDDINYTNACFFRSPKVADLTSKDWKLSLVLFKRFIRYVNPPWVLMTGKPVAALLEQIDDLQSHYKRSEGSKRGAYAYTGNLFGTYLFAAVPHPNAHISKATRQATWLVVSESIGPNVA